MELSVNTGTHSPTRSHTEQNPQAWESNTFSLEAPNGTHSSQSEHLALIRSHRQGATRSACRWWRGSHTMRATSHPLHLSPSFCFTHTYTQRQCSTLTKTHYNLWASAFTDSKNEEPDTVIHQQKLKHTRWQLEWKSASAEKKSALLPGILMRFFTINAWNKRGEKCTHLGAAHIWGL